MIRPLARSFSFVITDLYTRDYHNKERLLLHDSHDFKFESHLSDVRSVGRLLVWSTDVQLNLLFDNQRLHIDGTFCTAPPNFEQVFIIQDICHGTYVAVVYALLPDRKAVTYIHSFHVYFSEAKRVNKKFDSLLILTDFEPGIAKAIRLELTEKTIQKRCFIHFTQAVYRFVQSLGLSSTYLDNIMICSTIRQMMALALVPEQYVPSLFVNLGQELHVAERDEVNDLLKYFNDYWMKQISVWNVFDIPDKTNNFSEGYNYRFKRRLNNAHPSIWMFIDSLRKEVSTIHDLIIQVNSGMGPRAKRMKFRIAERRAKELCDRFNNDETKVEEVLHGLSLFIVDVK